MNFAFTDEQEELRRTVRSFIQFGAAGLHIEDQVAAKRCGHRPNKEIVPKDEMGDRVKAAVYARNDDQFVNMGRTAAIAHSTVGGRTRIGR